MDHTFELYATQAIEEDIFNEAVEDLTLELVEELEKVGGDFPYAYELQVSAPDLNYRKRVNFLKQVCHLSKTGFLSDDDSANHYQYIYFRPEREAVTIVVKAEAFDEREIMAIDYFFSPAWGIFATENLLTSAQEADFIQRFSSVVPELKIVPIDLKLINQNFQKAKKKINAIQKCNHYYLLVPPAESHWHSEEEKVEIAVKILQDYSQTADLSLCVFPVDSSVIENIPGGSDSKDYCLIMQQGKTEKIIYKEKKKDWW